MDNNNSINSTGIYNQVSGFLSNPINLAKVSLLYNLYDSAIANLLGLQTNRHGTSLLNYFQICLSGGKVTKGGGGETVYFNRVGDPRANEVLERCTNKIYVWNDQNWRPDLDWAIEKRLKPIVYSGMGNANSSANSSQLQKTPSTTLGYFLALVTPTVKFRFTPEEFEKNFKPDDWLRLKASVTTKDISVFHLGITGSLIQGLNSGMFQRIKRNIPSFMLGCVQLTAAIALTILWTKSSQKEEKPVENESTVKKAAHGVKKAVQAIALGILFFSTW